MDQLEWGQIVGMVRETHEGSWPQQLKHLGSLAVMGFAGFGSGLRRCWERTGGSQKCHRERDGREEHYFPVKFS
jgi:hypothetical protein